MTAQKQRLLRRIPRRERRSDADPGRVLLRTAAGHRRSGRTSPDAVRVLGAGPQAGRRPLPAQGRVARRSSAAGFLWRTRSRERAALTSALERCVARGTLLQVRPSDEPDGEPLYLLNTPRGRAAAEGLVRGEWKPGDDSAAGRADARSAQRLQLVRAEHRPADADDRRPPARGRGDLPGGVDRGSHRYRRPEQRAKMDATSRPSWMTGSDRGKMTEKIEATLKRLAADTSRASSPTPPDPDRSGPAGDGTPPGERLGRPDCPLCHGSGYIRVERPLGDPDFGRLEICTCRQAQVRAHIRDRLFSLSRLDQLQHLTFATFQPQRPGRDRREAADPWRRPSRPAETSPAASTAGCCSPAPTVRERRTWRRRSPTKRSRSACPRCF